MKQLILFDIDGTLIYHVGRGVNVGLTRFEKAVEHAFGKQMPFDQSVNYNGWVDRQIAWENVRRYGVTANEFNDRFPVIAGFLYEHALTQERNFPNKLYRAIPEAVTLLTALAATKDACLGILTGNVERVGRWKLEHAGIPYSFGFGLFGDEADDRILLAKKVFEKANSHFHTEFMPEDVTVIGDAIGDIRCAKAIRANIICVLSGDHTPRETLEAERPDILVRTLIDGPVVQYFRERLNGFPQKIR